MGLLLDRWHLAQQGEGQAIVLMAEFGMGKSRLVEALFSASARSRIGASSCNARRTHNSNTVFPFGAAPDRARAGRFPGCRYLRHRN